VIALLRHLRDNKSHLSLIYECGEVMAVTKKKETPKKTTMKKTVVKVAMKKNSKVSAKKRTPAVKSLVRKKTKTPVLKKPAKLAPVVKRKVLKTAVKKPTARKLTVTKKIVLKPTVTKQVISKPALPELSVRQSAVPESKAAKILIPQKSVDLNVANKRASTRKARIVRLPTVTRKTKAGVSVLAKVQETPPVKESFFQEVTGSLPSGYGDHFISLMICSPYQLYAYWEIQKPREIEALQILGGSWNQVRSVLRVYNLTQSAKGSLFVDLELGGNADKWFITVDPDQSYRVEIGLRHADGRFIMLARSNDVMTPRVTMSEVLDEEWMGIDFERMYALSGGFGEAGHHQSSATLQRLMSERLRSGDTSGSGAGMLSSGSMVKKRDRNFWFTLNCELIVYGATAPDAQVTMNGQPVQLRPDGTFTLRYPLPDGKIRLEAKAVSADLIEERTITPTVRRNTERPEPVIRRNRGNG